MRTLACARARVRLTHNYLRNILCVCVCVCVFTGREAAHLSVIHLVMPKELASEVWNEEAPSSQADQNTPESAARNFRGDSFEEEEETVLCEVDEDDDDNEWELSLLMPASPTLPRRPPPLPPSVLGHPRAQ